MKFLEVKAQLGTSADQKYYVFPRLCFYTYKALPVRYGGFDKYHA
jgi:hypothetical protein